MNIRLILLAILLPLMASAQEPCKVLMTELDSIYIGKCKDGLANGAGEAWGKFHYTGKFKLGYPDGKGTAEYPDGTVYVGSWEKGLKNGQGKLFLNVNGKVVEKLGIWANDTLKKEILPPAYRVITQRNVSRLRIYQQGTGNYVWFYPNSAGGVATDFQDFQLGGTSGTELLSRPKLGFQDVTFPFKGSIKYKAWNKLRTTQFEILVEIEISEPGNWIVEIQN
jgi:hypothetical protein